MAEILALGLTHYPPLWGPDERMSWIFRRMLGNPKLPEKLKQPEGWPESARVQWSDDQGTAEAVAIARRWSTGSAGRAPRSTPSSPTSC